MSWITRLFQRQRLERELDAELRFHLDQNVRELIAGGMSPEEARRQARLALGGVEQVKEETRDARGTRWLEDLANDIRFSLRMLRKAPGFTLAAIATLAIGIGANTAVYNVVEALFLRMLPVERPTELYALRQEGVDEPDERFSGPLFASFKAELPGGAGIAAMTPTTGLYLTVEDAPERVSGQLVSGEWFAILGVRPVLGRLIGPEDDRTLDGHPVAVLAHHLWVRRFGSDPGVVGRSVRINRLVLTVIGVAAPGFSGLGVERASDLWIPTAMQHSLGYRSNASIDNADDEAAWLPEPGVRWLTLVVRAPPTAPLPTVESRLGTVFRRDLEARLAEADSATRAYLRPLRLTSTSAARGFSDLRVGMGEPIKILGVTVGLVLLITCANLAGLILARNAAREHEISVRISLGARGGRLLRQVMTESITLAVIGGAIGLFVAWAGAIGLLRAASPSTGLPVELDFDWRMVAVALSISLVAGLLFGIPPAMRIARTDLYQSFRSTGRVMGGGGQAAVGRTLVMGQIAISLALIVLAAVLGRSVQALLAVHPGYDRDQVVTARIDIRGAGYLPAELPALHRRLEEAVARVPGVHSASLSTVGLASGSARTVSIEVPGKVRPPTWDDAAQTLAVTAGFFQTTGIPLVRGRQFTAADGPVAPPVAVISETMARRFFDTIEVVGKRFGFDSDARFEVIGVVKDVRANELRQEPRAMLYLHLAQDSTTYIYNIEARTIGDPAVVSQAIRQTLATAEPRLPIREIVTLGDLLDRSVRPERMVSRVVGLFGVLAALLAAVGLYGVLSYAVARRTNELGVRLALGASPGELRRLVVGDSMRLVITGVVFGLGLMLMSLGLVRQLVFGISPRDPVSMVAAVVVLLTVGFAAAALPAWRASRVDPVIALRRD
ncbi:MAG: ADOP family duplicated permease [Gemmatimonadales bacterium]